MENGGSVYGHWIDPMGGMIEVKWGKQSHETVAIGILRNLVKTGALSQNEYNSLHIPLDMNNPSKEEYELYLNSDTNIYGELYRRRYIRGAYDSPKEYYANGDENQMLTTAQEKVLKRYGNDNLVKVIYYQEGNSRTLILFDPDAVLEYQK